MLLEVLLGGRDELDGGELVPPLLEAGDDLADEAALQTSISAPGQTCNRFVGRTWTPSGFTAMKLCVHQPGVHRLNHSILNAQCQLTSARSS